MAAGHMIARPMLALVLASGVALGGQINVSSNSALNAANEDVQPGDTVVIAAGTYTVGIVPATSGKADSVIVYRAATPGTVTITAAAGITLSGVDYVYIKGIVFDRSASVSHHVTLTDAHHNWIDSCRFFAGGASDWEAKWYLDSSNYNRFTRSFFDGEDYVSHNDNRSDGILANQSSYYNVFEQDTVIHVSHFAVCVPRGPALNQGEASMRHSTGNIVRNCVTRDNHVNIGNTDYADLVLFEDIRSYSPGQAYTLGDGYAFEGTSRHGIIRYSMFYQDTVPLGSSRLDFTNYIGSQSYAGRNWNNRYYHNVWMSGYSDRRRDALLITDDYDTEYADTLGADHFVNNIFTSTRSLHGVGFYWQELYQPDTLRGNLFWAQAPGDTVAEHGGAGPQTMADITDTTIELATFESTNFEASPLWVDSTAVRGERSFQLSPTSLCVDRAVALTVVAAAASDTVRVVVGDAMFFHYDWGDSPYDRGDSVLIGTDRREIDSVDYENNILILTAKVTAAAGDSIWVIATYRTVTGTYVSRLSGSYPDVGPYELVSGSGGSAPDTITVVAPTHLSTQAQPTVLRWRTVSGATKYWLSLSIDWWTSLVINNATITDTFYTVSGLPTDTTVLWNVAAGNAYGWSPWNSDFIYYTAETAPGPDDTLTLSWNNISHVDTLTGNTYVTISNVQRVGIELLLKNPGGYAVTWDPSIVWPAGVNYPGAGQEALYRFFRSGSTVYGVLLGLYTSP